jgi:hypothetical protein
MDLRSPAHFDQKDTDSQFKEANCPSANIGTHPKSLPHDAAGDMHYAAHDGWNSIEIKAVDSEGTEDPTEASFRWWHGPTGKPCLAETDPCCVEPPEIHILREFPDEFLDILNPVYDLNMTATVEPDIQSSVDISDTTYATTTDNSLAS